MTIAQLHGRNVNKEWVPVVVDDAGILSGGREAGQLPATLSTVSQWRYVAASGGIVDTVDVVLAAAPGVNKANYLTSIQISNAHASVDTEVVIKDGSTVIWRRMFKALSVGAADIVFERPLFASNNAALNAACVTTGTATYINAQGYVEASMDVVAGFETNEFELFDGAGNRMVDGAGAFLYAPKYFS